MAIEDVRRRYHEALRNSDPLALHEQIQDMAKKMGVTYGDRTVCQVLEPLFVGQELYQRILTRAELVVSALKKAARHAHDTKSIWQSLQFTSAENELIEHGLTEAHPDQIARLDSFLGADGEPRFLEYNGESPGGIAYGDALGRIFDSLSPIQEIASSVSMSRRPVVAEVVRTLRQNYYAWATAKGCAARTEPQVAIVDLAGIPTRGEFEIFAAAFENVGLSCRIATPEEVVMKDDEMFVDDFRVDILYRRLLTSDLLEHCPLDHPLVTAIRKQAVFVANGFGGYLLSHKGLFAVLTDPGLQPLSLTEEEMEAVRISIPWTRILRDELTCDPNGQPERPIFEIAKDLQETMVLKQALGYGGQNVALGWTMSSEEWQAQLAGASGRPHVLQERIHIPQTIHPALVDGKLEFLPLRFDLDPYILGGRRAHGLGIRLAPNDLLNVASGAGSAIPAYVVSDT